MAAGIRINYIRIRSCNFNCVKALILHILPHLDNTIFNRANQMRSLSLRAKLHILADSNNNISKALLTYFAFLCFWTFQKEQMEIFHASERFRNTKWNFFVLLHTTETPNETFFMLLHTSETPKETFSCFCTWQKHQMKLFRASAHDRNTKWNFFMLLHMTETPNGNFSWVWATQKE